ncbi:MAG: ADP-ribosylglycohydrolase family protein [Clostridia bacterium]
MNIIPEDYIEKVYAGWLGKLIGIRHGAPIEGWTYEKIKRVHGTITDYLVDYNDFAADDDSNGPVFFLRALEDYDYTLKLTPEQIGLTWLNYAPYEHGFYWWGGYGKSTEHTAYLNMRNGIMAPKSGSIQQNGVTVAEQIGGQIFIDTWGLVAPANPKLAAAYARKAASVSHDGNGIFGGMFIAACISAAFIQENIKDILESGFSVIPADCDYTLVMRSVMSFHEKYPEDWEKCFNFIDANYGYDKYPGNCHIIPNGAVMILALLYGEKDFTNSINICNMCGWDTDCNVANIGTILGVANGIIGLDYNKWRKPINDFFICSSVIGSLNIQDAPQFTTYIAKWGYKIAGQEPENKWKKILFGGAARFHFQLPGSTHGFRVASDSLTKLEYALVNTNIANMNLNGSLKVSVNGIAAGEDFRIFTKTYYRPEDFHDSRYDPSFSPVLYPGQSISAMVMLPEWLEKSEILVSMYVKDGNYNKYFDSEKTLLTRGKWNLLNFKLPNMEGACLEEAGIRVTVKSNQRFLDNSLVIYIANLDFSGKPNYTIDFSKERMEFWNGLHQEVSQFTYLKGNWELVDDELVGSACDFGEAYTGSYDWEDYTFEATLIPVTGESHYMNFRVQGAIRSYAFGLESDGKAMLRKNNNGYSKLSGIDFAWEYNHEYRFRAEVKYNSIRIWHENILLVEYFDNDNPYLQGQIGFSVYNGSRCKFKELSIY